VRIGVYGFRDYDPDVGRWTAKDPILFESGSIDLYGYCLNDPINWVDREGLVEDEPSKSAAIRTAIQLADIIPVPHPAYQIPMEIGAFVTTVIDIKEAEVSGIRKAGAAIIAVYGLAGGLQAIPSPSTVIIGTVVDISAFIAVSQLLGEPYPGAALIEYIRYKLKPPSETESLPDAFWGSGTPCIGY
jgi:hypothetical protein